MLVGPPMMLANITFLKFKIYEINLNIYIHSIELPTIISDMQGHWLYSQYRNKSNDPKLQHLPNIGYYIFCLSHWYRGRSNRLASWFLCKRSRCLDEGNPSFPWEDEGQDLCDG